MIDYNVEQIEVCDQTWNPIDHLERWDQLTMTERLCDVGTGSVNAPATAHNRELMFRGCNLIKKLNGVTEMAGIVKYGESPAGKYPTLKVDWVSPMAYLRDRITYPDPGRAATAQTTVGYNVRRAAVSTILMGLASDNAGPTSLPDRRVFGLRLGDDPGVGLVTTFETRFQNLLDAMRQIALPNGVVFNIRTADREHILEVYIAQDLSDDLIFSEGQLNATNVDWGITPPEATVAIGGGSGDLTAREIVEVTSQLSLAEASTWGRRIEYFYDANNSTGTELRDGALRALSERAETVAVKFQPVDTADWKLGTDIRLGDLVKVEHRPEIRSNRVVWPAETAIKPLREIATSITHAGGRRVTPLAGDYSATGTTGAAFTLKDVQRRIAAFETRR